MSNFDPSPSCEVTVEMELFFQLQSLVTGESLPASFPIWNIFKVNLPVSLMIELMCIFLHKNQFCMPHTCENPISKIGID